MEYNILWAIILMLLVEFIHVHVFWLGIIARNS